MARRSRGYNEEDKGVCERLKKEEKMIVVDLPMPEKCILCPIGMDCDVYRGWLRNPEDITSPLRLDNLDRCKIKKEVTNEAD